MAHVGLAVLLLACLLTVNARTFITRSSDESDDDDHHGGGHHESETSYEVVFNSMMEPRAGKYKVDLGQVAGIAACVKNPNRLLIFQRGSREWTAQSFIDDRNFDKKKFGRIAENTIMIVNTKNGDVVEQWGNNTFYMPHGLSVDAEGNMWLTDVAMHQVFKYSSKSPRKLLLTLGEELVPGSDSSHFCKPTDVVVSNDGSRIFVADGYCNSRIVVFDNKGQYLSEYSMPDGEEPLTIPHSLVLIESLDLVCVADRANGRIVCFNAGLGKGNKDQEGKVKAIITDPSMKTVYAIAYDPNKHRLYAVSGADRAFGYTFSVDVRSFGDLLTTWQAKKKSGSAHDLALSVNGRSLYVGEIGPNRIDVFDVVN